MAEQHPAGWYADPQNPAQARWYDGAAWTEQVQPIGPPAAPVPSAPAPTPSGARTGASRRAAVIGSAAVAAVVLATLWAFSPGGPISEARYAADAERSDTSWYANLIRTDAHPSLDALSDAQIREEARTLCASLEKAKMDTVTTADVVQWARGLDSELGVTEKQAQYFMVAAITWQCPDRATW